MKGAWCIINIFYGRFHEFYNVHKTGNMAKIYSLELEYVIKEALDSSEELSQDFSSLHLLMAMYMLDNSGGLLLLEEGYPDKTLLSHFNPKFTESENAVEEVMEFAEEISGKYRSREVNCLHLLVALCRHRSTMAHRVMESAEIPISLLRNKAISMLVDMPKRYSSIFDQHQRNRANISAKASSHSSRVEYSNPHPPAHQTVTTLSPSQNRSKPAQVNRATAFPLLDELSINLMEKAANGNIEPVIGRSEELEKLVDILNKRKSNNPLIIGPPGVGKTALVEGLAWRMVHEAETLPGLANRVIYQLDASSLLKGTHLRGSFSERMDALRTEVGRADGNIIMFLDDIHTIAQGSVDGSQDIAHELKSAMAEGNFPCIGATTLDEFKKSIERDAALSRRFHTLELQEPDEETTLSILASIAEIYEEHHGVQFDKEALEAAVRLSDRYMRDRYQPDKSLTIIDLAGSRARRSGAGKVDEQCIAEVVSQLTAVPLDQLVINEATRYLDLEEHLAKRIIGHEAVLGRISEALRRNVAGFGGERPMGSFLFVGPTGVGKTEIARSLAEELFSSREAIVRMDMSEYSEAHSVAKMIGAPPGYVGFQEGGALTDAMRRRPFQIVLFDEIEKAHPDVHQLLLQVLDDGRLSDNLGRTVDFTHAVVIMTSNIGSQVFTSRRRGIGFSEAGGEDQRMRSKVLSAVREVFSPELYNRIDEKIVFEQLSEGEVLRIALLQLQATAKRLYEEKEMSLHFDENVPQALAQGGGYDPNYGARPMRRAIQSNIEGPLASLILKGIFHRGDNIEVKADTYNRFRFDKRPVTN